LTTVKQLRLRYPRNFNRLAALTNLEVLALVAPDVQGHTLKIDDFTQLLTLPNLYTISVVSSLPTQELTDLFSANRKLKVAIESNLENNIVRIETTT
jgi:hypothetical protein